LPKTIPSDNTQANRSTKFVTATPGEYCLVLKHTFNITQATTPPNPCDHPFNAYVIVKDANYSYIDDGEPVTSPPFPAPSTVATEYNVANCPGTPHSTLILNVKLEFVFAKRSKTKSGYTIFNL